MKPHFVIMLPYRKLLPTVVMFMIAFTPLLLMELKTKTNFSPISHWRALSSTFGHETRVSSASPPAVERTKYLVSFCPRQYICNSTVFSTLTWVRAGFTNIVIGNAPLCAKIGTPQKRDKTGLSEIRMDYRFQAEPGLALLTTSCLFGDDAFLAKFLYKNIWWQQPRIFAFINR